MTCSVRLMLPFVVVSITNTEESNVMMPLLLLQFYKDRQRGAMHLNGCEQLYATYAEVNGA